MMFIIKRSGMVISLHNFTKSSLSPASPVETWVFLCSREGPGAREGVGLHAWGQLRGLGKWGLMEGLAVGCAVEKKEV